MASSASSRDALHDNKTPLVALVKSRDDMTSLVMPCNDATLPLELVMSNVVISSRDSSTKFEPKSDVSDYDVRSPQQSNQVHGRINQIQGQSDLIRGCKMKVTKFDSADDQVSKRLRISTD